MEEEFEKLLHVVRKNNPESDFGKITSAWNFAKLAHAEQKRLSGDDYAIHPLKVAIRLAEWKLDTTTIIAGLLHDSVEEGGAKQEEIVKDFGSQVGELVEGVTKVTSLRLKEDKQSLADFASKREEFIESLRKMILVMAKDLRVVFIKLADRIHNLETLSYLTPENQKRNAIETLEVYAPLAERLGMGEVKRILEGLAFSYAYPEDYKKVKELSSEVYVGALDAAWVMKKRIIKILKREKVEAKIDSRKKHLYSLWKKLERPEISWDFGKINDLVALRILVDTVKDCYVALGVTHSLFKPVPHIGISDFIAQPKPNGYRSIHTKVFGPGGRVVEIQIRTYEMHEQAELGMAAHWQMSSLKLSGNLSSKDIDEGKWRVSEKLSWVKQLIDWQNQIRDSEEFLQAVKFDALAERIYVFSPKGDVFDLPDGATPIDFACVVHTGLLHFIKGAKVDGKIAPLNYKLKSGQVVEILKSKNPRNPSKDWLGLVVTTEARREIRKLKQS